MTSEHKAEVHKPIIPSERLSLILKNFFRCSSIYKLFFFLWSKWTPYITHLLTGTKVLAHWQINFYHIVFLCTQLFLRSALKEKNWLPWEKILSFFFWRKVYLSRQANHMRPLPYILRFPMAVYMALLKKIRDIF